MNRETIIDACERIRDRVGRYGADQDNLTFWHWDRAFWYATRALHRLGQLSLADPTAQIAEATIMIEKYS